MKAGEPNNVVNQRVCVIQTYQNSVWTLITIQCIAIHCIAAILYIV